MKALPPILLLSPHSDDIVLSIGGLVANGLLTPFETTLHTVFTQSNHAPYREHELSIEQISQIRKAEDQVFCREFGFNYSGFSFKETLSRGYGSVEEIFNKTDPSEDQVFPEVQ